MPTGGLPPILEYIFAPRRGSTRGKKSRILPASQTARATREREISGYMQANPEVTREQARRRTADLRRRGYVPETVRASTATPEQQQRAEEYRERSERAQRQRFRGGGGVSGNGPMQVYAQNIDYEQQPLIANVPNPAHRKLVQQNAGAVLYSVSSNGDTGDFHYGSRSQSMHSASLDDQHETQPGLDRFRGERVFTVEYGWVELLSDPETAIEISLFRVNAYDVFLSLYPLKAATAR